MSTIEAVRQRDPWHCNPDPGACPWLSTQPGQTLRYAHPVVGEAAGGSQADDRSLPVTVVHGAQDGPLLLLIAGEHGNEYESIVALQDHLSSLDAKALYGRVVAVGCCSVDSYVHSARVAAADGRNLARCYPGRRDGTLTERVAWTLQHDFLGHPEAHRPALLVALHTYGPSMSGATLSGYNTYPDAPGLTDAQRQASLAAGLELAWGHEFDPAHAADAELGDDASGRTALYAAFLAGVPAVYWETTWGNGGEHRYRRGLQRVMGHLGMLPGGDEPSPPIQHIQTLGHGAGNLASHNQTPVDGLWVPAVRVWDEVESGDLLGVIRDLHGRTIHEIRSQQQGLVIMLPRMQYVPEGTQCGVVLQARN